ncbi:MAG: hypothetical protein AAF219_02075 [Myxococcota bacterium]
MASLGEEVAPWYRPGMTSWSSRAVALMVLVSGCSDDDFGEGTRRPPTELVDRADPLGIQIAEVFIGGDESEPFVELVSQASDRIELQGFRLSTDLGSVTIVDEVPLDAGGRVVVDDNALTPSGSDTAVRLAPLLSDVSGEAALIDPNGTVQTYVAWGGDPGERSSTLFADAFAAGIDFSGPPQLAAPYPIAPEEALVFEDPRGCSPPTSGTTSEAVEPCGPGEGRLVITEFQPAVSGSPSWIEIRNTGSVMLPLEGVRICVPPVCATIDEASATLGLGEYAVLFTDVDLTEATQISAETLGAVCGVDERVCATARAFGPVGDGAELAIARPGGLSADAESLLGYARLGSAAGEELETEAVEATLWQEGVVVVDDDGDGTEDALGARSYQLNESLPAGPDGWIVAEPSPFAGLEVPVPDDVVP